jgi:hypothetical protein
VAELKLEREKRQFGHHHGLSPEETDYAFELAHGKPTEETLKSDFFQGGLERLRAKSRTDSATPGSSNRSPKVEGKTFRESSNDEREKGFGNFVAGLKRK